MENPAYGDTLPTKNDLLMDAALPEIAALTTTIDAIYKAIGAKVIFGVSYGGESGVSLFLTSEVNELMLSKPA